MTSLPEGLDHLAVIMDGNGRWAEARGLPRTRGHKEGVKTVRLVTTTCASLGLKQLTLYAMSVENFLKRPRIEVEFLLALLKRFLRQERRTIMENDIRFRVIGRIHEFPASVQDEIRQLEEFSAGNRGMVLCLALNYGGRAEISDAVRRIAALVKEGRMEVGAIDEDTIRRFLYDPNMKDPDLLVRTAGELRISNFLLWQLSYSEIWVTESYWPDFGEKELEAAFTSYAQRHRKFGGLAGKRDA